LELKPRDRILAAIELREADRVPLFELAVSEKVIEALTGQRVPAHILTETTSEEIGSEAFNNVIKAHVRLGLDGIAFFALTDATKNKILDEDRYVDEWGRIFSRKIRAGTMSDFYIGGYLTTPEKYYQFPRPDPYNEFRIEQFKKSRKAARDELYIIPTAGSIYEYTVRGIGDENVCRYAYTNPSFLERVFKDSAYYTIEVGKQFIDEGAEAVFIFEDYAYKHGPFLHPRLWRELVFPRLKEAADAFHKKGAFVLVHSDGNILPLMDMIIEAGVDGVHSLEPASGIDLARVKEEYGDRLCLIGNIDVGNLLPYGSEEEVSNEVRRAIAAAAPGGGYILSTCSAVTDACKPENFATQISVGRSLGRYPKHA
jgi:uroporphyrinogen decarboxylase